jgi:hypothetical protein
VALLGALVRELARDVQASGGRLAIVFAGPPNPWFELQEQDLRASGIAYLDATAPTEGAGSEGAPLRRANRGLGAGVYYRHNLHWNPAGHREVAQLVTRFLRDERLCPQEP